MEASQGPAATGSDVPKPIFHVSHNDSPGAPTVLLLHGLGGNHLEFTYVIPHISPSYHIILVDLPGHYNSSYIPCSVEECVRQLAALIEAHATDKRAHVVGASYGAMIALELARQHPSLVASVFTTGFAPFTGVRRWAAERPRLLYSVEFCAGSLTRMMPEWMIWDESLREAARRAKSIDPPLETASLELVQIGTKEILAFGEDNIRGIEARALVMAGGKVDDVEGTRRMGRILKERNQTNKAAVIWNAIHPWHFQFPELFAQGVIAWIEGKSLPKEFEELL